MPLHFSAVELADRRTRTCAEMASGGLDGLLCFRQESMFWLTGYDTFGYVHFQCLYLGADGTMTLLTRAPDLRQAQQTSVIDDIRIWVDLPDASPADQLRNMLESHGCRGKRLGIEWEAYGLTANNGRAVEASMGGFCTLEDASRLVSKLRLIKSPAELDHVRRAGQLADQAWDAAVAHAEPGAFEGDILANMQGAVFRGGGDYPGNEFIIGSGPQALLCRYYTGRRHLDPQDQLTLEFAGVYRRYHAALMRTMIIGHASARQTEMHSVALASLEAAKDALKPGRPVGDVFDAHARVIDAAGMKEHRLNACGYSLGTTFAPNWMDWPMFFHGNPVEAAPGMVFFIHIVIFDSNVDLAMTSGQTVIVDDDGLEVITKAPTELVVK